MVLGQAQNVDLNGHQFVVLDEQPASGSVNICKIGDKLVQNDSVDY